MVARSNRVTPTRNMTKQFLHYAFASLTHSIIFVGSVPFIEDESIEQNTQRVKDRLALTRLAFMPAIKPITASLCKQTICAGAANVITLDAMFCTDPYDFAANFAWSTSYDLSRVQAYKRKLEAVKAGETLTEYSRAERKRFVLTEALLESRITAELNDFDQHLALVGKFLELFELGHRLSELKQQLIASAEKRHADLVARGKSS